jgi:hypothetical protein
MIRFNYISGLAVPKDTFFGASAILPPFDRCVALF